MSSTTGVILLAYYYPPSEMNAGNINAISQPNIGGITGFIQIDFAGKQVYLTPEAYANWYMGNLNMITSAPLSQTLTSVYNQVISTQYNLNPFTTPITALGFFTTENIALTKLLSSKGYYWITYSQYQNLKVPVYYGSNNFISSNTSELYALVNPQVQASSSTLLYIEITALAAGALLLYWMAQKFLGGRGRVIPRTPRPKVPIEHLTRKRRETKEAKESGEREAIKEEAKERKKAELKEKKGKKSKTHWEVV